MPDAPLTASVESTALIAALDRLGVSVETYTKPTAKITADNIAREAKARVARRTGETAAGIVVDEDYGKVGYVVRTSDVVSGQERAQRESEINSRASRLRANRTYQQEAHVGLYLEYGTKHMSKREFFFPSVRLEEAAHDRRMRDAIQAAIDACGLGEI